MFSREFLEEEYWNKNKSPQDIAYENNTYPNNVRRHLLKYWSKLRDHSDAQKIVVKTKCHPTKGRERSEEEKKSIAEGLKNYYTELGNG